MRGPKDVTIQLVRRRRNPGARDHREMRGFFVGLPRLGRPMEVFVREDGSLRTIFTSSVHRILTVSDLVVFVETANSVYRLTFDEPLGIGVQRPALKVRVRLSPDGSEVTVVEGDEPEEPIGDLLPERR